MRIESGHHEAGLLVRVQDAGLGYNAQKGYFAGLQAGTGKLVFCAFDGSRSDEIAVADHPVACNKWYTLRVDAAGDLLHVYVNDELMITARDSCFHTGMAGLRVVDTHAEFTDFEISPR